MTLLRFVDAIARRWLMWRGYQVVSKSAWRWMHRARRNERNAWINAAQNAQRERDDARAEVITLSGHMIAHNILLQDACEKRKASGECANVGMCDSCPRDWMIDSAKTTSPEGGKR